MSWRCDICETPQPPGTPLRRHTIYRDRIDGNGRAGRVIAREIPCCADCQKRIDKGQSLRFIHNHARRQKEIAKTVKPILFNGKWVTPQTLDQVRENN